MMRIENNDVDERVVERVRAILKIVASLRKSESPRWLVLVKCPQDQLDNVFSSSEVEREAPGATIPGSPANNNDEFLNDAAEEVSPANSLSHASDSAKYVVQSVSLVSTVVGVSAYSRILVVASQGIRTFLAE